MEPVTSHTGTTAILRRNAVDTDQIIPVEFCRGFTRTGYAPGLFANWRKDPEFVLNDPARSDATVLIADADFGTGSSREHAVWALRDWGLRAVLAQSFGDIFRRNAWKNGLLAVTLDAAAIAELMRRGEDSAEFAVTVDLVDSVVSAPGVRYPFEVDPRARRLVMNGLDEIEVSLSHGDAVRAYEHGRASWLPTFSAGVSG